MSYDPDFGARLVELIPRLRRYARVLASEPARGDDLVQDTLERAWSRRAQWRRGSDLRAWLFTIMHNRHVDSTRGRVEAASVPLEAGDEPSHQPFERRVEPRDLERALATLPAEQREALLLVVVEQMSYGEAAATLGVPIGTVMSRLARARDRLRDTIEPRPLPSHGNLRRIK